MLRESNVLKFVKNSSVMRPGYYIGIDTRRKLVILGIRGTHTVYDLITDVVSSSDGEVTFEGYSTHFGTAEAARWFLTHEMGNIRKCLEKYEVVILYFVIVFFFSLQDVSCLRILLSLLAVVEPNSLTGIQVKACGSFSWRCYSCSTSNNAPKKVVQGAGVQPGDCFCSRICSTTLCLQRTC